MNTRFLISARLLVLTLLACILSIFTARADFRLPNQPKDANGYYIVKWDCENDTWAASNDMEYDETFVLAVDLTGTAFEQWVSHAQNGYPVENTGVVFNAFMNGRGNGEYMDRGGRLWHIRDNIYGATYNFAQRRMQGGGQQNWTPVMGEQREIHVRIFPFATMFGVACHETPSNRRGSVWSYDDNYASPQDNKAMFRFAPYTGTKTSPNFDTRDLTDGSRTYYDNDHYVETEGYAGPRCFELTDNCCPSFAEPVHTEVQVKQGTTPDALEYEVYGNATGATYVWYRRPHDNSAPATVWNGQGHNTTACVPSSSEPVGSKYDYWCVMTHSACDAPVEAVHYVVEILENCPDFTWAIDGTDGLDSPLYPGGWYDITCTSEAGAPTVTITGTGIRVGTATTAGNTTTVRLTLTGTAAGTLTFLAASPAANGFQACEDEHTADVGDCSADRVAKRIKWDANKGYVADNGTNAVMVSAVQNDNSDLWEFIPTGSTITGGAMNGEPLYYVRNAATGNYLHRGSVLYDDNDWGYGEAETGTRVNPQTAEYQWAIHYEQSRYFIICAAGYDANQWDRSYGLHYRGPEWAWMFCEAHEPHVCDTELACGKLAGQPGSPAMRAESLTDVTVVLPTDFNTTAEWAAPMPADPVNIIQGQTYTHTASRMDELHSINTVITYKSDDPAIATVNPQTGEVTAVGEGDVVISAILEKVGCFEGDSIGYNVHVTSACPEFTWAIDDEPGLEKPMMPGGWYLVSCTTEAGAPTITITGTGVAIVGQPVVSGNTTTVRVELQGNAAGTMTFTAESPASGTYTACTRTLRPDIAPCDGATHTYKIEWYNYNGDPSFPQYWIHNGASVYLRDNNGRMEADIPHSDGQDEWFLLPTGNTVAGEPSYYIQNALTRRYLYRGAQHGNVGGDWEYAEALLGDVNLKTVDYQWVFYPAYTHTSGVVDTAIICVDGLTGTQQNIRHEVYMLHTRLWEATTLFSNPAVTTPGMVCGKMANQYGSPVFYMRHLIQPTNAAISNMATPAWNQPAPASPVSLETGTSVTHTASRVDDIHSINQLITYSSSDPAIASVNPRTGEVTGLSEGTATITATMETVGCFEGDIVTYEVQVWGCPVQADMSAEGTQLLLNLTTPLHLAGAKEGETAELVYDSKPNGATPVFTTDSLWSSATPGTYTLHFDITNADHPDCNRSSNTVTITVYDCRASHLEADNDYVLLGDEVVLTLSDTYEDETGELVFTASPEGANLPAVAGRWTPDKAGIYTLHWEGTSASHPDCELQSNALTITVTEPYVPTVLIFDNTKGTGVWSDAGNWGPAYNRVPVCDDNIRIIKPCRVDRTDAQADTCTLAGGTITILPTGGLTIRGLLVRESGALQPGDITVRADAKGNGALVLGEGNRAVPATVEYYSLAYDGETNTPTWQYIAAPIANRPALAETYPAAHLYAWTATPNPKLGGNWQEVEENAVAEPFAGYCITQDKQMTYTLTGTLADPIKKQISCPYYGMGTYPGFCLVGNSWVAPIRVADMVAKDFGIADATVYVYNTGTYEEAVAQQSNVAFGRGTLRGQYNALPIHAASYMPGALQTIPPMQGFFVYIAPGKGPSADVTLDYSRVVMDATDCHTTATPMRAPKRQAGNSANFSPDVMAVTVSNALWSDRVWLLRDADFTSAFDNGWDGRKVIGRAPVSLAAESSDGPLAVAALNQWEGTELSFAGHNGLPYTLTLNMAENMSDNAQLLLLDRLTQTLTPISNGAEYTFTATADDSARFRIIRKGGDGTEPEAYLEPASSQPVKFIYRGHLYIRLDDQLYDGQGHRL